MSRALFGIGVALLAHAAVILFGGLMFNPPARAEKQKQVEVVDLVEESERAAEKDNRESQPEAQKQDEARDDAEEAMKAPDLTELSKLESQAAVPALDAVSLSALEDLLNPGAMAAAAGNAFAGSVDLSSGGEIGGTGRAASAPLESIFTLAELDQKPRPVFQAVPTYPLELRKRKIEGSVYVLFVVDERGRVVSPRVEKATRPEFEAPALEAVRQWKFEPGVRNGRKVQTRMRVPLRFTVG